VPTEHRRCVFEWALQAGQVWAAWWKDQN